MGNGHILFGYPICVDYWMNTPGEKYFRFLTHLHADHTVGLKSTFREKIFTSQINKWLLTKWFKIDPNQVTAVEIGHNLLLGNTDDSGQPFVVTLIDANHCPGSVMFLFQGNFGNILYTGDFRYSPDMLTNPMLKSLVESEAVNSLYLDNTFAADHCEFPPKEELVESILDVIRSHPDHYIIIGMRKLGKEEIIRKIGLQLKEKVCVSKERFELLTFLQFEQVFTTNQNDSRIFIVSMPLIESYKTTLQEEKGPVIIIILSAFYYQASMNSKLANHKEVYIFPYSDHSSHSELENFVCKVKPHSIYPIVSSGKVPKITKASPGTLEHLINSHLETSGCDSVIPQSILRYSKDNKKHDTFEGRPNLFPTLQPKTHSHKLSIKESSKLSFNADNTDKNNKTRHRLKQALIREHNNTLMDSMSSENTIIADLFTSDETIQPHEKNPTTSSMISNKILKRGEQSHTISRDLGDNILNTRASKCFSMDVNLPELNALKENGSFTTEESDQEFYPLSQEELKQQKSAEDCKSLEREIDNNHTINIVVQIPHGQSCEITNGAREGQTRLKLCENTNKMYNARCEDLSLTGSSLTFNDNSSENNRTLNINHGMAREDMDVNLESRNTRDKDNISQMDGIGFKSSKTHNMTQINVNPTENSGSNSEAPFSQLQSNDLKVSTDHFYKMPVNKYDKVKFSLKSIHCIPFNNKINQVLQKNFLHAMETWENSIGRKTNQTAQTE